MSLLARAYTAHGGSALTELRTWHESDMVSGSGPFGIRMPAQQSEVWLDRPNACGRWQIEHGNNVQAVFQQTPETGVMLWTEKTGTRKCGEASPVFSFVPLLKTGIIGLLALQTTRDPLRFVERGEIKGRQGAMIIRTQPSAQITLLLGKGNLTLGFCQTTWAYLFAPDGTLIGERITQMQPKNPIDTQMSYERFETVSGIKVPTEISVASNQIPRGFSLRLKVRQLTINAPIAASTFPLLEPAGRSK